MSVQLRGISSNLSDVNSSNQLKVVMETSASNNPQNVGCVRMFSEVDNGAKTGIPQLLSPEVDSDYRIRTTRDVLLDNETFNYTAQNTGKHTYANSTLTATWGTSGLVTNGGSVNTTGTGLTFGTYAEFPLLSSTSLYAEFEGGFTAQPPANVIIDFGMFRRGASTAYAPTDGIYFRLTSAGLQGVINTNGSETTTAAFNFTYNINQKYEFVINITERECDFWINNVLYGTILTPAGLGQPCMSATLPMSIRHAHTGTAGAIIQFILTDYSVSVSGMDVSRNFGETNNAIFGSYQGLSGGTMGSLSVYTNSTNPTAAAPSNTTLTANLPSGLGGQAWETYTTGLAANTDGILMSYQVPAGTVSIQGKRLKINGVKLSAFVQTTLTGGGFNTTFALAFGHTAVSLATGEAATTKARRIVLLPELTQIVPSGQAATSSVSQPGGAICNFTNPLYVNSGEFIALTLKHIGTVATAGTIAYNIQYDYSWE